MMTRPLGRLAVAPTESRTVVRLPWGRGTEALDARGTTALACAALFGIDGVRVGRRSSLVAHGDFGLDERLRTVDPGRLRRRLLARRAQQAGDRAWYAARAIHLAAWGESCVDALPDRESAAAISDRDIIELAAEMARFVRSGRAGGVLPDVRDWRGGLYRGVRDQHRLTVGVQFPWPGEPSAAVVCSWLGRVGAPGVLVRTLAEHEVPYYAAAAMPVVEHGTACVSIGLSTTTAHVPALLAAVRDVVRRLDGGIPAPELPRLRAEVRLYDAVHPPTGLAERPVVGAPPGKRFPAVAVVGRLTEPVVAAIREAVDEW
jgi:hypothetical protein